jgi:hypothetical protein
MEDTGAMQLPDCQIIEVTLPFTVDTDIVEVDLPTHFRPISLTRKDSAITLSALVAAGQPSRCARFRRYTAGQTIAGLDALNVVLSTTPTFAGSVLVDGHLWHVFHEPTPSVPGMDDLIRRFATAPNTPPTAGGASNA